MKQITGMIYILFSLTILLQAQQDNSYKPVDQPDADGRIIKGREGTHHWQSYTPENDPEAWVHFEARHKGQIKEL